ncbi:hypothetical protein HOF40_02385 [Candidatus Parcubacteria bacterium]|jgi:shikimate kinase|nr:hypothetical protein [Candidatus Parcubacteria bacterium]MBT3948913.1 hypothetical protein [Candidatus Parcubacteria bacterium]
MKHIILIGFKHTGKSAVGAELAVELGKEHVDIDAIAEQRHKERHEEELNSRQIVQKHGLDHFRGLEKEVLREIMESNDSQIISLGGGTIVDEENRDMIKGHTIVHVTAPRSIVYERIMVNGKPAFFPDGENSFTTFKNIWNEREPQYEAVSSMTVNNDNSLESAVKEIRTALHI